MVVRKTKRGGEIVDCGSGLKVTCHSDVLVWIGLDGLEVSLTKRDAQAFISHLQAWVETGSLELKNLKGERE